MDTAFPPARLRADALDVWHAAVAAVLPRPLTRDALTSLPPALWQALIAAPRVLVVGAGKAGGEMAAGAWDALSAAGLGDRVTGLLNVPEGVTADAGPIRLHPGRPAGSNHPTQEGVAGALEMLELLATAGPDDVALCLLSGGGSALLPAPADGLALADKQAVTKLLHASGATIREMNAVRKHLSRVKGGRLAEAFRGRLLVSLIVSDVVGDPLDVIASGPTAADPTTFAGALAVLDRYGLRAKCPPAVVRHLERGAAGEVSETPKAVPDGVVNRVIGSNGVALAAAEARAADLGYRVLNLGAYVEGETRHVAAAVAGVVRSILADDKPLSPPACVLLGGETTVTLGDAAGKGGRNQEFALAAWLALGPDDGRRVAVLSGGTDGEDGPTDAAGAVADADTWGAARAAGLDPEDPLRRHDAYPFFDRVGGLIRTGLTGTNVMDVRVIVVG